MFTEYFLFHLRKFLAVTENKYPAARDVNILFYRKQTRVQASQALASLCQLS